jgi:hypothetical protein
VYIGKLPEFAIHPSKFFSGNGTAMTITLDHAPPNRASILVFIDGVRQDTNAYTISGTSLTFTGTVPSGTDNIQVIHLGVTASAFVPDVDTIVTNMLTNGSVTSPKLDTNIDITGNLTVDTDTLYVDSANDRVGIGTSIPSAKLEISNSGTSNILKITRSDTGQYLTIAGSATTGITFAVSGAPVYTINSFGHFIMGTDRSIGELEEAFTLQNSTFIGSYNNANNGDFRLIGSDASNNIVLGSSYLNINTSGNVGIGTTQPQRSLVNKGQRRIISSDAVSYDENRWFTHEAHYNIAGVTNTAWTNLVTWQPYLNGTSNNPGANSLWTRVLIEVRAGGHSSAVGSGDIHAIYSADYNGSGCSGVATKNTLFNDAAAPDIGFAISGWSVTLQIRGASGTTGSLGGYCYVKIHFGGGEGVSGEAYEWSVTDYE